MAFPAAEMLRLRPLAKRLISPRFSLPHRNLVVAIGEAEADVLHGRG
jgi:hypothetical protein